MYSLARRRLVPPRAALKVIVALTMSFCPGVSRADTEAAMATIRITLPDAALTATMNNSAAAQDFLALLPLTLTLKDFNLSLIHISEPTRPY